SVLPRMFKHCSLDRYVHQLNKYEFHKVKGVDLWRSKCTFIICPKNVCFFKKCSRFL
ncbi:hypothetical protein DFH06DRAFT_1021334, partial [Mycena polygramma]